MNKSEYKEVFSAFHPSEKAVERIFDMTTDKKKICFGSTLKKICAAVLAFVLVIGGGFGLNSVMSRKADNGLGILVACAGELLDVKSVNEQKLFYRIYVADLENEQEISDVKNEWGREKAHQLELAENLGKKDVSACVKSGSSSCCSTKKGIDTAAIYTLSAGVFSLQNYDYTNVKRVTVENSSEYGVVELEIGTASEELVAVKSGHQVYVTGDELAYSIDNKFSCWQTGDREVNAGFDVYWEISEELKNAVGNNIAFDFSNVKDTITFTVNYLDGTSEKTSVNLIFDSDGYMHISNI